MKQRLFFFLFLALAAIATKAQDDVVYRLELGGGLGVGFSLNDTNTKFYGKPNVAAKLTARFPLNPRMAMKAVADYTKLSGSTTGQKNFMPSDPLHPGDAPLQYTFSGGLYSVAGLYELHFLPYGWAQGYQGYKRIAPFIQMGLGVTYAEAGKAFTVNIPIGFGVKWKIKERVNLGFDWTFHFTPSDKLDGLELPRGIKSSEFRNKDHYGLTTLTLTYDLSPKCPTCNKAD